MTSPIGNANWVAVDWGTTNLRVWIMDAQNKPMAQETSDRGMGQLSPEQFEPALLDLIEPYLAEDRVTQILCAGMVGARQGWSEAAYQQVPCPPAFGAAATRVTSHDPRIAVHIIPGLSQNKPPDVMRGEETQIAGVLLDDPDFDGVLCLPGTHTKWVRVSAGEIVSFQTVMTGEIFALLSEHSILRHSVDTSDWDQPSFLEGVRDAMDRPQAITAALFSIRAGSLIAQASASKAYARLSGLLIGIELAATKPYWLGQNVAIVGAGSVAGHYQAGLDQQGVAASVLDAQGLTEKGLTSAYQSIKRSTL